MLLWAVKLLLLLLLLQCGQAAKYGQRPGVAAAAAAR
jgi:hypothetical protein